MPRLDLSKPQREYAIYALKQMQKRDKLEMDFNVECAKAAEAVKDLTFGRLAFSIPEDHRAMLAMIFPEIDSQDAEIRTKAWKGLMRHELTRPYLLNAKEQGKKKR